MPHRTHAVLNSLAVLLLNVLVTLTISWFATFTDSGTFAILAAYAVWGFIIYKINLAIFAVQEVLK